MIVRKARIHGFGGPEVLRVEEVEQSEPDASQVLVGVKAASINPVIGVVGAGPWLDRLDRRDGLGSPPVRSFSGMSSG